MANGKTSPFLEQKAPFCFICLLGGALKKKKLVFTVFGAWEMGMCLAVLSIRNTQIILLSRNLIC